MGTKKIFFLLLLFTSGIYAQLSTSKNYVSAKAYQKKHTTVLPDGDDDVVETVNYYDGLGRPLQRVAIQAGGDGGDVITHIGYDGYGREIKKYLPYNPMDATGAYRSDALVETFNFYDTAKYENTSNPYSETRFEVSPLERPLKLGAPGEDWKINNSGYNSCFDSSSPSYNSQACIDYRAMVNQNMGGYSGCYYLDYYAYDSPGCVAARENYPLPPSPIAGDNSGNYIEYEYGLNKANEVRKFKVRYSTGGKPILDESSTGYYAVGELYKTIVKDENHNKDSVKEHSVEEFKDKEGRVILKRTYGDSDVDRDGVISAGENAVGHDTYYVYDDYGNLSYVIPPLAADLTLSELLGGGTNNDPVYSQAVIGNGENLSLTSSDFVVLEPGFHAQAGSNFSASIVEPEFSLLEELSYQYVYDGRNRLIEKKTPGKGWEYIVYNKADQPIMTQSANDRKVNNTSLSKDQWLFTKYDAFGRVVYTGLLKSNDSRTTLQSAADAATYQFEVASGSPLTYGGGTFYYTDRAYPYLNQHQSDVILYTVNYYDDYRFYGTSLPQTVYNETVQNYNNAASTKIKTKGLATGSKVRVLTTNDWITTVMGYDKKGRMIYSKSDNPYLHTTDETFMDLDFVGKVKTSKNIHKKLNLSPQLTIQTEDFFTYDHMGRLEKHTQKIDQGNEELIALNEYDELGQLKTKKVGNAATAPLQTVDYTYNIRGWLKTINDPSSLGDDLFSFKINYNTQDHGATPLYNGNISETEWRTANTDNSLKWYTYGYDALNRITYATDNLNRYSLSSATNPVSYDKNGNITSLLRKGHKVTNPLASNSSHFGTMDDLSYVYDSGNKLLKVTDAISLSSTVKGQFNDGNTNGDDYTYDANGNLTRDLNKGIVGTGNAVGIVYNHLNLPVSVKKGTETISYIYDATGGKLKKTAPGQSTEYAGNYVYKNGAFEFFNQPEGYVEKVGSVYKYVYQYKDHLGNVRLSYQDKNNNNQIDVTTDPNTTEIISERNYYPFGLQHKGYNNVGGVENNYHTYQGQEIHKELGLDAIEFKYRFYYPDISRFWSIDPLAEKYNYNSTYAFSENKLGMGIELEGLEVFPTELSVWFSIKASELKAKFNGGAQKVANANNPMKLAVQQADPNFDPERARIERVGQTAQGLSEMAEATADVGHVGLEGIGIVDPTGIADVINAGWYAAEGDYLNATLSGVSIFPYLGDAIGKGGKGLLILGKAHKISKYANETKGAAHMFKEGFGLGLFGLSESNTIMQAMYQTVDHGGKLLFDLGDVSLDAAKSGFKSYDAAAQAGKITEWELSKVLRDKDLFNNAVFHIDGVYKSASDLGLKLID